MRVKQKKLWLVTFLDVNGSIVEEVILAESKNDAMKFFNAELVGLTAVTASEVI